MFPSRKSYLGCKRLASPSKTLEKSVPTYPTPSGNPVISFPFPHPKSSTFSPDFNLFKYMSVTGQLELFPFPYVFCLVLLKLTPISS